MKKTSDNGYFIISPNHEHVLVEKAHFCTWNLPDGLEFLEVGLLVKLDEFFLTDIEKYGIQPRLKFKLFIPWYGDGCSTGDLFSRLTNTENARFIFNDDIPQTNNISDGGRTPQGVRLSFREEKPFCLLPVSFDPLSYLDHIVSMEVSFPNKVEDFKKIGDRIYLRFFVKSKTESIPWTHGGIATTSYFFDIKVNEPRNAPSGFPLDQTVRIRTCYCLHIVPASFECALQDRVAFKSIRTLEATEAVSYTSGVSEIATMINPGDCLVVFNKLKNESADNLKMPFSFFTVFTKERIGPSQLALAIGANIVCNLLAEWSPVASLVFLVLTILSVAVFCARTRIVRAFRSTTSRI